MAPVIPDGDAAQHPKPNWGDFARSSSARTHESCPSTRQCPPAGSQTRVFIIQGGKPDAAFGNLFYATVANAVIYADNKGLVPYVRFDPQWTMKTMGAWSNGSSGPL